MRVCIQGNLISQRDNYMVKKQMSTALSLSIKYRFDINIHT